MIRKIILGLLVLLIAAVVVYFSWTTPVTEHTDPYAYELPFKAGSSYRVVQGYGGIFSHRHQAALDFAMPEGTPIHAARGGVVYSYRDEYAEGGADRRYSRRANYIMIRHSDGSFGCYWHLKKGGVVARKGKVKQGQLIGYSGNTGFTLRPHLHFTVKRILNYEMNSFVKTRFKTNKGVVFLKTGRSYQRPLQ